MKEAINSEKAPQPIGTYSQAVKSGNMIFVSGQLPIYSATGKMCEGPMEECARLALINLQQILGEAGGSMNNIVKLTIFLKDITRFERVNAACSEFFTTPFPSRSVVEVCNLPAEANIAIDAIAVIE
ncbi:MAG: Rid family detoxifying hydrolase [Desulfovibrionales bacterium]|nr:Rid family detoxifying hydrolase [Desulfovibrionales bacterium]